ncbi:RNA ligase family protein [Desmospora activa]|uniref:RNA ligase n=1 Tax=Desmospora activa DSM 45169 TaxID=1121389 RepID=A0A2T4Z7Q5_9BACL|nr:RNA ligase family protein [Desmospora activa]PTM57926.1 RNA ligase [Desmospora activa DSM 45169]
MERIYKYPRTPHISGSGLQAGDEDLNTVSFHELAGKRLVVEEKMDGANSGISFDEKGQLYLQSRGHFLMGGAREAQFHLLKSWAHRYAGELWALLGKRYVMYGEWLYAKHTVFYTDLPHYFLEFDIYDKEQDQFLSTERRRDMLTAAPFIVSVKVLIEGSFRSLRQLQAWIGDSHFIAADHVQQLRAAAAAQGMDPERVVRETDMSRKMEGLYIKLEENGVVKGRYKYVRNGFLQTILDSNSHWMERPLLPNRLQKGVSLF